MLENRFYSQEKPAKSTEFPVQNGPAITLESGNVGWAQLEWDTAQSASNFTQTLQQLRLEEGEDPQVHIRSIRVLGRQDITRVPFSELNNFQVPIDTQSISVFMGDLLTWKRNEQQEHLARIRINFTPGVGLPFATFYRLTTGVDASGEVVSKILAHPTFHQK